MPPDYHLGAKPVHFRSHYSYQTSRRDLAMSSDKDSPAGTQLEESQRAALENQGIKTVTDDDGNIRLAAGHGQLATDQHGNPLVTFDPVAVEEAPLEA